MTKRNLEFETYIGKKFNRLTILDVYMVKRKNNSKKSDKKCMCLCECGNKKETVLSHVISGHTKSCNCYKKEIGQKYLKKYSAENPSPTTTHGMNRTKVHNAWKDIKKRCLNKNFKAFHTWGGRGIEICKEWQDSFIDFYNHIGKPPEPSHLYSVDRINNNGNYEPGNVRWATKKQQAQNRRCCVSNHHQALSQT